MRRSSWREAAQRGRLVRSGSQTPAGSRGSFNGDRRLEAANRSSWREAAGRGPLARSGSQTSASGCGTYVNNRTVLALLRWFWHLKQLPVGVNISQRTYTHTHNNISCCQLMQPHAHLCHLCCCHALEPAGAQQLLGRSSSICPCCCPCCCSAVLLAALAVRALPAFRLLASLSSSSCCCCARGNVQL